MTLSLSHLRRSIKWLSSPPSQKARRREEGALDPEPTPSPERSKYSSRLAIRSPLRRLSDNELPMSSASIESRGSLEALSDLRRKIKSVETSLKDKKVGMMVGGGKITRRMKRDLEDIRERR